MAIDSMISREESGAIKGLLILLIVLGHIGRSFGFLQHWLYSFHFIVFFMLSKVQKYKLIANKAFFGDSIMLILL